VREAIAAVDPRLPIYDLRPMETYVADARAIRRFTVLLAAAFALSALGLTSVGVYGVLAYSVAVRRHEFGVRRALGADAAQVRREVLREGLGLAVAGAAAGLATAAIAATLLHSQLYGVEPRDPITYAAALALLVLSAIAACWIPARRAAALDPVEAMRTG
jgi:putative ABC transport system permease protein